MFAEGLLATVDVEQLADAHVSIYEAMNKNACGRYICFDHVIQTGEEAAELERQLRLPNRVCGATREVDRTSSELSNQKLLELMNSRRRCTHDNLQAIYLSPHSKHIDQEHTTKGNLVPHSECQRGKREGRRMSALPQPMVVYPQSMKAQQVHDSEGSFTPVYITLAVIAVLTIAACYAGQVLASRYLRPRPRRDKGAVEEGIQMGVPAVNLDASGGGGGSKRKAKHLGSNQEHTGSKGDVGNPNTSHAPPASVVVAQEV
ncbi:hypothetical protein BHE74_00015877 [Ensete ventricosum]|nr:hypothetical protein BHE74_00015877 [Ensete ventricosum]